MIIITNFTIKFHSLSFVIVKVLSIFYNFTVRRFTPIQKEEPILGYSSGDQGEKGGTGEGDFPWPWDAV